MNSLRIIGNEEGIIIQLVFRCDQNKEISFSSVETTKYGFG